MSGNDDLKKQIEAIQNQLDQIIKTQASLIQRDVTESAHQERVTYFALVFSMFMSALIGVVGNWFVTLWFQPATLLRAFSLGASLGLLLGFLGCLFVEIRWVWKQLR